MLDQKEEEVNYTPSNIRTVSNNDLNRPSEKPKPRTRKTFGVTKGKFEVSGYKYLSDEIKKIVFKQVKVGDKLTLVPDPTNKHSSSAIKVMWNENQIGWYSERGYRKEEIFNTLLSGENIDVKVLKNVRVGDYDTINGLIEYHGMIQCVEGEFKYQK
jgi:hypothetical protein